MRFAGVDMVRVLGFFALGGTRRVEEGVPPAEGGTGEGLLAAGVELPARRLCVDVILVGVRPLADARDGVLRDGIVGVDG